MELTGIDLLALRALYEAQEHSGDLGALLKQKSAGITLEQAWGAGKRLYAKGYLESYNPSRAYADAILGPAGVKYAKSKKW